MQLKRAGVWIPRRLVLAVAGKNPPQKTGGMKELERSGVWAAHRSFASGRPNETACGLHTASVASGRPNETACGLHAASFASGRPNETACGMHTASLSSEMTLQEGGGTNALLPTRGFRFRLLPPPPSSSYSLFCPPRSLGLRDVAFDGGRFCRVTWHGRLSLAVGDVVFDGGAERLLLGVGDVPDVARPHPSTRGGAVVVMWRTRGPPRGGDVAMAGGGDVA
jgi:hypothetical protein